MADNDWTPLPQELDPWDVKAVLDAKHALWRDILGPRGHLLVSRPVFCTTPGTPRRATSTRCWKPVRLPPHMSIPYRSPRGNAL